MQILNIAAVSIVEAFATQSNGEDKKVEKTIYIVVIVCFFCFWQHCQYSVALQFIKLRLKFI